MILVANRQRRMDVAAGDVRKVVRGVYRAEGSRAPELSIAVVDDATIRELNRAHLGHDWATDAITFSFAADPGPDGVRGEVVVSAETALREAEGRGTDPRHELLLYVAHGTLHLLGWEDDTPARRRRMNGRAAQILEDLGIRVTGR